MVQKQPTRPRGRPREYDPDRALVRATESFWRAGFSGTSLDDLSAATGMNRPSLYGAFGDKRELYLATLERYVETARADMAAALSDELPLALGVQRVYSGALDLYFASPETPLGCFLIGTAATEAACDSQVRATLGSGLRELTRAFERRFRSAREVGELAADADPALLAELAGAVLHSLALRSRAGDPRPALEAFARGAVRFLCGPTLGKRPKSRRRPR
ncbi:MAG TPA: TetR/AcrR family transcriptional regulator [Myxococcota bacterium]|nr:TetR/AcrR family transcriptional regulator [Myxococcota bacterium]